VVQQNSFRVENGQIIQSYTKDTVSASSADVISFLKNQLFQGNTALMDSGILPHNCRMHLRTSSNEEVFVVEMKPGIQTLHWNDLYFENEYDESREIPAGTAEVAMPWQYFIFRVEDAEPNTLGIEKHINTVQLLWAKERLTSRDAPVSVAQIPNVDDSAYICLGDAFPQSDMPIADRIDEIMSTFYSELSTFNHDLGWHTPYGNDETDTWVFQTQRYPNIWKQWSLYTLPFSNFVQTVPVNATSYTIDQLLTMAISNTGVGLW